MLPRHVILLVTSHFFSIMPLATIKSASAPHHQKAAMHKSAPVLTVLHKEKAVAHVEKQAVIDEAIGE